MPVIYVEPPVVGPARHPHGPAHLWKVNDSCHVLPSPGGLPGDRAVSTINAIVQKRLGCSIAEALARLDLKCAALWIDRIESAALLDRFPESTIVYDCVDEEWTFGRLHWKKHLRRLELALVDRADVTIAASAGLCRRLSAMTSRVELVPNGCDFEHFSRTASWPRNCPDLPRPGAPIIGFIGGITRRALDYDLLEFSLTRLRHCQFVFVGAFDAASKRAIGGRENVTLLGPRDYSDLPAYLSSFDAAIIPYAVGREIDYVYPKKLHEYLAAGKPVVATDLPELRPFEGVIRIGRSPDEFVRLLEASLRENADPALSRRLVAQRQAVAKKNTWAGRVEQIAALLDAVLRRRGFPGILEK